MLTNKYIKEQLKKLTLQRLDLIDLDKHLPERLDLLKQIYNLEKNYRISIEPKLTEIDDEINSLNNELRKKALKKELPIDLKTKEWFKQYTSGIDMGYKSWKIVYISDNKKWVIIHAPGRLTWGGHGSPRRYAESEYWVCATDKSYHDSITYMKHSGRLTKDIKQKMIKFINEQK